MKRSHTWCDQCESKIDNLHVGLEIKPLPGALLVGDWRDGSTEFCGVTCLNNYVMENWPNKETVEITHAITAGKVVLNAFRQGILATKNAQWLIWLLADVANLTDILVRYPEWNPDSKAVKHNEHA